MTGLVFITLGERLLSMYHSGGRWLCFLERFKFIPTTMSSCSNTPITRYFCASTKNNNNNNNKNIIIDERYQQLENLDMATATKILFSEPPKEKKFGFDFHLVQFFFACLPSLAVYLLAQYARYDIRKMEVEVEQKRKQKEEEEATEKEKEMELNPPEEKEAKSDLKFSEVKERLEKLEEAVKGILIETKKQSSSNVAKNQVTDYEKKHLNSSVPSDKSSSSASNKAVEKDHSSEHNSLKSKLASGEESKGSMATPKSSPQDPKGLNKKGRAS